MRWSYSASRSFRQCQRQWYFKNVVSSAKAKDPLRKRAYLLGKLRSVSAWRGQIVDDVISRVIVPCVNRNTCITLKQAKRCARELFERQLAFGRRHPIDDLNLRVSEIGQDFALFHAMEYNGGLSQTEIDLAWKEVETALENLFELYDLKQLLKSSDYIITQRALQFPLMDNVTVLAYPDAIAFHSDSAPTIIDWKVHAFGQNDAWLQLAIYAIALNRCKPHSDFPALSESSLQETKLYEAQLLTNIVREHVLDEDQFVEAEECMIASAFEMTCLTEGDKYSKLDSEDFTPALYAETCQRCAFRKLCWKDCASAN
ncbi:MAG: PD-(D/E)XK nuclease family protein [Pseudomonadota bacterium]